jgi:hypothetical protein
VRVACSERLVSQGSTEHTTAHEEIVYTPLPRRSALEQGQRHTTVVSEAVGQICRDDKAAKRIALGLVYSLIGHRIGYGNLQEVSRCIRLTLVSDL